MYLIFSIPQLICVVMVYIFFLFSSRRRHTILVSDWSSDVCSSDLIAKFELTGEEQATSAALLWLLRGDAGQRALIAWSMGWEPAKLASGQAWLPPFQIGRAHV